MSKFEFDSEYKFQDRPRPNPKPEWTSLKIFNFTNRIEGFNLPPNRFTVDKATLLKLYCPCKIFKIMPSIFPGEDSTARTDAQTLVSIRENTFNMSLYIYYNLRNIHINKGDLVMELNGTYYKIN